MEIIIGLLAIPICLFLVGYIAKLMYDKGFEDGYIASEQESISFFFGED